jgi:SAM-dependent methyltransferase
MPDNASGGAKRLARRVGSPLVGYFDNRFGELLVRLDQLHETVDEARKHSAADASTIAELSFAVGRFGDVFSARMEEVASRLERLMIESGLLSEPGPIVDSAAGSLIGGPVSEVGPGLAELMSWANSFIGWAGQSGLRMNDGVYSDWVPGGYVLREVNERIVELPFAFGALADLEPGARVLDVGSCESTLALAFASVGYDVTALDIRPYPFDHPNLTIVTEPIEEWTGPEEPFDAVFAISTIEHLGQGAYGEGHSTERVDQVAMDLFRKWLRPGGELVLTVPYGIAGANELERTYDAAGLKELLDGWEIRQQVVYEQVDPHTWVPAAGDPTRRGVALVRAVASD